MAGDWIPMRIDLHDDPAVLGIAAATGLEEDSVIGKLLRIWGWAQGHTTTGLVPNVTLEWINRKVNRAGFAEAMVAVGWLSIRGINRADLGPSSEPAQASHPSPANPVAVVIPKFERWLGKGAKARLLDSQRKKLVRNLSEVCPENVLPTEEKRRVQKKKTKDPPHPPPGGVDAFERFWQAFPPGRKTKKAKALAAWKIAIRKTDPETIIAAAAEYAASPRGQSQYVCGPLPWLNGACWDDDRRAWNLVGDNGKPPVKKDDTAWIWDNDSPQ